MWSFLVKADNIKGNTKEIINSGVTEKDEECPVCQKSYQLEDCLHFIKFSVEDGIKMFFKEKWCFGCYQCISKAECKELQWQKDILSG